MKRVSSVLLSMTTTAILGITAYVTSAPAKLHSAIYMAGKKDMADPNICGCPVPAGNCICKIGS
jgi:hypothetical protein